MRNIIFESKNPKASFRFSFDANNLYIRRAINKKGKNLKVLLGMNTDEKNSWSGLGKF